MVPLSGGWYVTIDLCSWAIYERVQLQKPPDIKRTIEAWSQHIGLRLAARITVSECLFDLPSGGGGQMILVLKVAFVRAREFLNPICQGLLAYIND